MPAASVITDIDITGAFGVCVVNTDAFVAGVAAVPGPFDEAAWEGWFVWRSFSLKQEAAGTVASLVVYPFMEDIDSKAMRKVTSNETVVLVAESQGGAFRINVPLRMLFKLS